MVTHVEIINGMTLSNMVDYSFGDHLGGIDPVNLPGGFMKFANEGNVEFFEKAREFEGRVMTLFIDNIRLYNRPLITSSFTDSQWVNYLLTYNDLLRVCASLQNNKFVIFTSHEDTPIDEMISLPDNVLGIHAVNAVYNNDRIHPFPIGLQREIGGEDNRMQIMEEELHRRVKPTKLLYINCGLGAERNQEERAYLPNFARFEWATCRFEKNSKFFPHSRYREFLTEMRDHKFVVCPKGHGMDCHRNWESLYLRRVPVFKDHPYFRVLMKDYPVLFVNEWSDITPRLLVENDHLFRKVQRMKMAKLDLSTLFTGIMANYKYN